jgi:hypothetical protein
MRGWGSCSWGPTERVSERRLWDVSCFLFFRIRKKVLGVLFRSKVAFFDETRSAEHSILLGIRSLIHLPSLFHPRR